MAEGCRPAAEAGFSLVELLVALAFTMVLMAGMANVYKASLSTFYASGESISSSRRGRMSVDLLVDDLNLACLFLTDLAAPPPVSDLMAPFRVLPNMPVAGHGESDPAVTDELYFYTDQVLPFEAILGSATTQMSAAELILAGTAPRAADTSFTLACGSASYAGQVQAGQALIFLDALETASITGVAASGSSVTVTTGPSELAGLTGSSGGGGAPRIKHRVGSRVLVVEPAQMVRYRIEMVALDPAGAGVPCLVRDQGPYSPTAFTAAQAQQVIAEQVAGFSVYLSANGGTSWAGLGSDGAKAGYSGYDAGWEAGLRSELDAQLATAGRPDFRTTRGSPAWFRSIPVLVRVDITTRSATQRTEYAATAGTVAHRTQTQSLVVVPRHAGLAMN